MAADRSPSTGGVQSVDRALDLLELMAEAPGELGLSQLSHASGLPVATIHRLMRTLAGRGYVRQLPSRRYGLGPRLIWLSERASRSVAAWARPVLAAVVDELGETANLATLDGDMVVYIAHVPSSHPMRMFTEVGRRVHLHSTGVGKAVLAQLSDDEIRSVVARTGLPHQTPRTITDLDRLLAEIATVRRQGYAVDDGEQEVGVRCFAVPVPGAPTLTAISVSGPDARIDAGSAARVVPALQRAARSLTREFHRAAGADRAGRD